MIRINRLRLEIQTTLPQREIFGFDIPFGNGLNIIAGENTKGKSTIGTSIYYALGMEELLGAKNEKALGKALKNEFETSIPGSEIVEIRQIMYSTIFIELSNEKNEIVTLRRAINSGNKDQNGSDVGTKRIFVFNSSFEKMTESSPRTLFLRNENNNSDEHGFYFWLAKYIGIELPEVTNTSKA
ncbi:MAG: hypothetical protein EOO46_24635, partial [Flavobacterium sp.]